MSNTESKVNTESEAVSDAVKAKIVTADDNATTDAKVSTTDANDDGNAIEYDTLKYDVIPAKDLHVSKVGGWLESRFHFRFAGWRPRDKKRHGFGALHVMNDDLVQPGSGFGFHPHKDQEIFSYILNGYLTHKDSEGNSETLGRGAVQYMSAGSGVWHSEYNNDKKEVCRFLQIWIYPNARDLDMQYGSLKIDKKERHNKLMPLLSGTTTDNDKKACISLSQDVNIFVGELDYGKSVKYTLKRHRNIYLVCAEGTCDINGGKPSLKTRDAVRIYGKSTGEFNIEIKATYKATNNDVEGYPSCHFLMIEMDNKNTNWHRTQASMPYKKKN
mmetsp:Transcript_70621/g.86633  ORF Transcript_70621/g.86633 Transcript_70621/m.86633 type:complete len:329 (+) Transcript_70621:74-1060(+)